MKYIPLVAAHKLKNTVSFTQKQQTRALEVYPKTT